MNKLIMPFVAATLAACGTIGSANLSSDGPSYIGKSASELFAGKGTPIRQVASPGGATIYVYETHNLYGSKFCEGSFYIRDDKVVGFQARGPSIACGASAGNVQ